MLVTISTERVGNARIARGGSVDHADKRSFSPCTPTLHIMILGAATLLLALGAMPTRGAPAYQSATLPTTNASIVATKNVTAAVESCSSRMDGKLPPFIPTGFE